MNIAIIPARGGSKRLPGKNIKALGGKPLIIWTIEAALFCDLFDSVLVSTDCHKIAKIARSAGASVPFIRPTDLSGDTATTNDVVSHAVSFIEDSLAKSVTTVTLLQPTSPLRTSADIKAAHALLKKHDAEAIVSVCELEHPIQFCSQFAPDGSMNDFIDTNHLARTQDLAPYYRLNGAIYIFKKNYVGKLHELYGERTFPYVMTNQSSVDIDTQEDFSLAEYYLEKRKTSAL